MIFEKNVDIPLKDGGLCRGNVYRPLAPGRYPVIATFGPYGKDIPYSQFHVASFEEIPAEQKSEHSAWETPHPEVNFGASLSEALSLTLSRSTVLDLARLRCPAYR